MSVENKGKRKYELRKRAARAEDTRRRIIEATVNLHRTIGPARTEITEIARQAGVQRVTVYSHFPDETSLLGACSAHWRGLHPAPSPDRWQAEADPGRRLRLILCDLYGWYRETEPMTANVLRDMELIPALHSLIENGLGKYLASVHALLVDTVAPETTQRQRTWAVVQVTTGFPTWKALSALGDETAADLAAGWVEFAACCSG